MYIQQSVDGEDVFFTVEIGIKNEIVTATWGAIGDETPSVEVVPEEALFGDTDADVAAWLTGSSGPLEGGVHMTTAAYNLSVAQKAKRAEIKARRYELEEGGLATTFGVVDSDSDSQRKISGGVQMALISMNPDLGPFMFPDGLNIVWRFMDNTTRVMPANDMVQMGVEVGKQVAQCQMVKNYFDGLVDAAMTVDEVNAIDVQVNWFAIDPTAA